MYDGDNRVQQVSALRELAADLVLLDQGGEATAEEIVEYALSEGCVKVPAWFDGHDRGLLVEYVQEALDE